MSAVSGGVGWGGGRGRTVPDVEGKVRLALGLVDSSLEIALDVDECSVSHSAYLFPQSIESGQTHPFFRLSR